MYHKTKNSLFFLLPLILMIGQSCSKKYLKGSVYIGSGGGFAGTYKEYQLNTDGRLYFLKGNSDSVLFLKKLDSTTTKKLFKKYYKLKLDREDLDAPGNMYYYVGRREGKFRNHKITFGNPEAGVSENIKEYYDDFNKLIADSTQKSLILEKIQNSKNI
jgi:hypothetical protein